MQCGDDRGGGGRMGEMLVKRRGDSECSEEMKGEQKKNGVTGGEDVEKESLMMELTRLVQKTVKESSWWERRGIDCSILAAAFLCLPPGKKLHAAAGSRPGFIKSLHAVSTEGMISYL